MKTYPSMCYERNFASKALGLQNSLLMGTLIKTNCGVAQAKKCSSENGVAFCVPEKHWETSSFLSMAEFSVAFHAEVPFNGNLYFV